MLADFPIERPSRFGLVPRLIDQGKMKPLG